MASSSTAAPAVASTHGGTPLGVASWNFGIPTEETFRRDNRIVSILERTADILAEMLMEVDIVAINELHPAHQAQLNTYIVYQQGLGFLGFESGDGICWRP